MKQHDIKRSLLRNLSAHLFWDIDTGKLDYKKDKEFIIGRIFEYGYETDEKIMYQLYSLGTIKRAALRSRSLSEHTVPYAALVLNIKESKFKCCEKKQYLPNF